MKGGGSIPPPPPPPPPHFSPEKTTLKNPGLIRVKKVFESLYIFLKTPNEVEKVW